MSNLAAINTDIQVQGNVFSTFTKKAKFKPHAVIISKGYRRTDPVKQENANSLFNLAKGAAGQYNGYMSPATRRRVKGIVENFLTAVQLNTSMKFPKSFPSAEVYPTFVTLTLPCKQHHCDNDIKKECFFRFMEYLQGSKEKGNSGWNVKNYIWVSETQKNGNIHFHIILDRAIPAQRLNEVWNRFIDRLGYVDRFRNTQNYIYDRGFYVRKQMLDHRLKERQQYCRKNKIKFVKSEIIKLETQRQKEAYKKGIDSNWSNPPSTKIHSIQNIKKLTAYVSKYMTKEPSFDFKVEAGQQLIQENGKFFVVTSTTSTTTTYEQTKQKNGIVHVTEHQQTVVNENRKEVKIQFDTRRLRGRIWGCSADLHTDYIAPLTVNIESFDIVWKETIKTTTKIVKKPVKSFDIFGNEVIVGSENVKQELQDISGRYESTGSNFDDEALLYCNFLEQQHVSADDIEKATSKAGDHFKFSGGKIIPLEVPQKDVMQAFYPPMHKRYLSHYSDLFKFLYPNAM